MEYEDDMPFEMQVAGQLVDTALDYINDVSDEDKDDVLIEIFSEALSGLLVAFKICNPTYKDAIILSEVFDKVKLKYQSRTRTQIVLLKPEDIN